MEGGLGIVMGNQKLLFEIGMVIVEVTQIEVIEAQSVFRVGVDIRGFGFHTIKKAVEAVHAAFLVAQQVPA